RFKCDWSSDVCSSDLILIILAGVMGADGVILAAASAHQADAARLAAASSMLLFHATAVLAVAALAERGIIHARIGIGSAFGFVIDRKSVVEGKGADRG